MRNHIENQREDGSDVGQELASRFKLSLIPIKPARIGDDRSGKLPAAPWKPAQTTRAPSREVASWFDRYGRNINLAAATGRVSGERGIYVIDLDTMDEYEWWVKRYGDSPVQTRTGRGMHLYYDLNGLDVGNAAGLFGRSIDGRGTGGYVLVFGQHYSGATYERIGWTEEHFANLPQLDPNWIGEQRRYQRREVTKQKLSDVELAAMWLASTPGSASESGDHNMAFRIACRLVHPRNPLDRKREGFGLSADQALPLMLVWNAKCKRPWSLTELKHKLSDAVLVLGSRRNDIIKTIGG